MQWHALEEKEVLKQLKVSSKGLSKKEAEKKLEEYGKNELISKKTTNPLIIFLKQFNSYLIYILIAAAIISYFFDHHVDMYVIIVVILINAIIGFIQERNAERSIQSLKKLVVSYAKVYRDGNLIKVPASKLVPGDIIILEEGDRIPADCRLLSIKRLRTNEASLTGESFPIDKRLNIMPEKTSTADQTNMIFMSTYVVSGSCKAIVVNTSTHTAIGRVAKDIEDIKTEKTHFQRKTDFLAKQLGAMAVFSAVFIFIIGYLIRGIEFQEIFLFTLASLVSVIPEGLPAVLAIVLAVGAFRMSRRKAIIRHLPSTETLGVVTTIVTDKTGTLTKNTMNVSKISLLGYSDISVTGIGWNSQGNFIQNKKQVSPLENNQLSKLLHIAAICNKSNVVKEEQGYSIVGDPTEAALVVLGQKAGLKKQAFEKNKIDDLPFNPELKYRASLSTLVKSEKRKELYVVGAPEAVLLHSSHILKRNTKKKITDAVAKELTDKIASLTNNGMRVLALAYKDYKQEKILESQVDNLVIAGIVGIIDPPRPEVKKAISKAKKAGIRVVMATGDHRLTALAIAKEIGLANKENSKTYTGKELEELSDEEFNKALKESCVFARLTPSMKLKIASSLQSQGQTIAMTGDGVNDAPALKKADVGVSMGQIGTDVARESSDIILADDNFATIVNAVEEGRIVFTNTRQTSSYLITTNFAEATTILVTLAAGWPLPLLPTQILWLNLVTGGGTDVSLATEKSHHDILKDSPKKAHENFISKDIVPFLLIISLTMVAVALAAFYFFLPNLEKARTAAFTVLTLSQLFNVYNMRSLTRSVFSIGIFSNKWVNIATIASLALFFGVLLIPFFMNIFEFTSLTILEFFIFLAISSLVLWIGEGYKFLKNK